MAKQTVTFCWAARHLQLELQSGGVVTGVDETLDISVVGYMLFVVRSCIDLLLLENWLRVDRTCIARCCM
jgi:hypothetical protein